MNEDATFFIFFFGGIGLFVFIIVGIVIHQRYWIKVKRPRMVEALKSEYSSQRIERFISDLGEAGADKEIIMTIRKTIASWSGLSIGNIHCAMPLKSLGALRSDKSDGGIYRLREMLENNLSTVISDSDIDKLTKVEDLVRVVANIANE